MGGEGGERGGIISWIGRPFGIKGLGAAVHWDTDGQGKTDKQLQRPADWKGDEQGSYSIPLYAGVHSDL